MIHKLAILFVTNVAQQAQANEKSIARLVNWLFEKRLKKYTSRVQIKVSPLKNVKSAFSKSRSSLIALKVSEMDSTADFTLIEVHSCEKNLPTRIF